MLSREPERRPGAGASLPFGHWTLGRKREATAHAPASTAECACAPPCGRTVAWKRLFASRVSSSAREIGFHSHLAVGKQSPSAAQSRGRGRCCQPPVHRPPSKPYCSPLRASGVVLSALSRASPLAQVPSSPTPQSPPLARLSLSHARIPSGPLPPPGAGCAVSSPSRLP